MNTLGIDIGSSFLKAAVFSLEERRMLRHESVPALPRLPDEDPLKFELDAEELYRQVRALIDRAAGAFPLKAILFSTQMHGFVFRTPGAPDRYISWQDSRCTEPGPDGVSALEKVRALVPESEWTGCGVQPKPALGACNLYALLHGPQAPADGGELFTLGSYLIWRLTGSNVCHISNAAPLGLADVRTGGWAQPVLQALGLQRLKLPRIAQRDFECCGVCRSAGQEIAVCPDYGDQQVSVLGAGAGLQDAVVNIATACQVCRCTDRFCPGPYEIRPYFDGRYLNTVSNMPGGRNLAVLTDFLRETAQALCGSRPDTQSVWAAVESDFAADRGDGGLSVNTLFYPTAERLCGGEITGIRPDNLHLSTLFGAAYRDMAQAYARQIGLLSAESRPARLIFSGGVSWKNPRLVETAADAAGLPHRLSLLPQEALNGLYRLSLAACGEIGSLWQQTENNLQDGPEKEKTK